MSVLAWFKYPKRVEDAEMRDLEQEQIMNFSPKLQMPVEPSTLEEEGEDLPDIVGAYTSWGTVIHDLSSIARESMNIAGYVLT